ncbi:MAG: PP2C family protein-serine/threonine phosphatase [Pseudomonadota bacterium]
MGQISEATKTGQGGELSLLLVGQDGHESGELERALRAFGGKVRRASTALNGVAVAQGLGPDAVIVHWRALDVAGPKFLRMLLDERLPKLPYIIVAGGAFDLSPSDHAAALRAGADYVLHGGDKSDTLEAVLRVAARRRARAAASKERFRRVAAKLSALQESFDSLDSDLAEARKLQQGLMKERSLDLGPTRLSMILRSSGHVGGDLVGHYPINDTQTGFFALDVSGHGVSSALMTARLAGYLSHSNPRQNIAIEPDGAGWRARAPAAAVSDLNQLVMEDLETDHYFTMLLGVLEPATGRVTITQAGHPHPARQHADGTVTFLGSGGLPVGLIPGADYEDFEVQLSPGDRLLMISDGFTESTVDDGSFLGDAGLVRLLDASRSLDGVALLEALVWDLSEALGDTDFQDDLSGVLIEYFGNPKT